ncbi:TPA: ATP-dependent Clp protease proteolytic subunit [Salmonella enterica]|nr:ATP-dependent Clp protease proteolytic subunit [Salmonella enterica]
MTVPAVSDLIKALDDAGRRKGIQRIFLYINSYGGDMDSGLMAAAAIRSSAVPVTTIAMSTVGSSATLMLCAAKERKALPEGSIYFHPSFIDYKGVLRPDTIDELNKELERFRIMFKRAYKQCSNLKDSRIDEILHSESNRITFTPEEAITAGIISGTDEKIINTPDSWYITSVKED